MAKCGQCTFNGSSEAYLKHECLKTGYTPEDIEHQDALTNGGFSRISRKSQERAEERIEKGDSKLSQLRDAKEQRENPKTEDKGVIAKGTPKRKKAVAEEEKGT